MLGLTSGRTAAEVGELQHVPGTARLVNAVPSGAITLSSAVPLAVMLPLGL